LSGKIESEGVRVSVTGVPTNEWAGGAAGLCDEVFKQAGNNFKGAEVHERWCTLIFSRHASTVSDILLDLTSMRLIISNRQDLNCVCSASS